MNLIFGYFQANNSLFHSFWIDPACTIVYLDAYNFVLTIYQLLIKPQREQSQEIQTAAKTFLILGSAQFCFSKKFTSNLRRTF